ncbi:hypothetical protein CTEN210_00133 [Chaetoceros tenuissimus]|uniref:G-protein coupled receptors family 1 profile domain-containing protein n=1 Tax=Chaetoceros tenuissimus TaxID=426638 RepID=A0AAD3CEL4_9STRA|nr:hypothetical protein CTEN210_00133 [Chaetoceros tenuissimus]
MSEATQEVLAASILRCIMASLSLASSSTIVHSIRYSPRGLKSPYSRIIFGLSVGDIIQSCAIFVTPFAVPHDNLPKSPMAFGNTQTCDYAGFILLFGGFNVVFYLLFLIYFFWRRVKHRVSPKKFAYGEERYFHVLFWILAITIPSIALARKEFNPSKLEGGGCMLNAYPNGCEIGEKDDENYTECTRGQSFRKTGMVVGGIIFTSLLCMFILFASIICHVYAIEKSLSSSSDRIKQSNNNHVDDEPQSSNTPHVEEDFQEDERHTTRDAENVEEPKEKESLTRSALTQSLLYMLAFIFTYSPSLAYFSNPEMVDSRVGKSILLWGNATIYPIYGIFLILIYTRPKVQILSKMFPKASWSLCFQVVLGSGGEVPPAHELKPSHLPQMSMEVREAPESPPFDSDLALSMSEDVSYEEMKSNMMAVSKEEGWSNQAWSNVSDLSRSTNLIPVSN